MARYFLHSFPLTINSRSSVHLGGTLIGVVDGDLLGTGVFVENLVGACVGCFEGFLLEKELGEELGERPTDY